MGAALHLVCFLFFTEATYRVPVTQLKFQDENNPETFIEGIKQVETDGSRIYVMPINEPTLIVVSEDGRFIRRIGRGGSGPEEWLAGTLGVFQVKGPSMWVLLGDYRTLLYYENDKFVLRNRIDTFQLHGSGSVAYDFAFDNQHVVIQSFPGYGHLANAYNYGGKVVKKIGGILPREPEFLAVNPALNNTIWATDGRDWYCLFVHRPILRKYDKNFELADEFMLQGPEIAYYEEIYFRNEKDPNFDYPRPHFNDMKIYNGHIYLFCRGTLYQVSLAGEVLSRMIFYGKGGLSELMREGKLLFRYFTILDSGKIVLADDTLYYESDLLTADLPFLTRKRLP